MENYHEDEDDNGHDGDDDHDGHDDDDHDDNDNDKSNDTWGRRPRGPNMPGKNLDFVRGSRGPSTVTWNCCPPFDDWRDGENCSH